MPKAEHVLKARHFTPNTRRLGLEMMRDARLRAAGVGTLVPMLALAAIAALACGGLQLGRGRRTEVLGQVGEEAFVDPLNTETPADMALKIQGILVLAPRPPLALLPPRPAQTSSRVADGRRGCRKRRRYSSERSPSARKNTNMSRSISQPDRLARWARRVPRAIREPRGFKGRRATLVRS